MSAPGGAVRAETLVYAKLVLVAAFWGGQFTAARVVAQLLPQTTNSFLRFAIASAILLVLVRLREGGLPRLDRRGFGAMLALALTGVVLFNVFFFAALERLPAARGALIVAMLPAITALGAWLFLRERMTPGRSLGIALALAGVTIVIARGDLRTLAAGSFGTGELLMLGTVLCWTSYTLIGRGVMRGMSPLGATTWAALIGTVILAAGAALEQPWAALAALPPEGWLALAYLGALGTVVAFLWFYQGVLLLGPARTTIFMNFVPVFGVVIAVLLLGEPVLPSMLAGGALVIAGVALTSRPAPR